MTEISMLKRSHNNNNKTRVVKNIKDTHQDKKTKVIKIGRTSSNARVTVQVILDQVEKLKYLRDLLSMNKYSETDFRARIGTVKSILSKM